MAQDNLFADLLDGDMTAESLASVPEERGIYSYDFRRPDRIPRKQLRSIELLHETFAHNLSPTLSTYLRVYVNVALISVEQLSFREFVEGILGPSCLVVIGIEPHGGNMILELTRGLVFPVVEILLGGHRVSELDIRRDISDVEKTILQDPIRIIVKQLQESWKAVAGLQLRVEGIETEPQFLQVMPPGEAVIMLGFDVKVDEVVGIMNLAVPSMLLKLLQQKGVGRGRRAEPSEEHQRRVFQLIQESEVEVEALLEGPRILLRDILNLQEGQILALPYGVDKPLALRLNGVRKFSGRIVQIRRQRGFKIESFSQDVAPLS